LALSVRADGLLEEFRPQAAPTNVLGAGTFLVLTNELLQQNLLISKSCQMKMLLLFLDKVATHSSVIFLRSLDLLSFNADNVFLSCGHQGILQK
jgi:hypothetical protein